MVIPNFKARLPLTFLSVICADLKMEKFHLKVLFMVSSQDLDLINHKFLLANLHRCEVRESI